MIGLATYKEKWPRRTARPPLGNRELKNTLSLPTLAVLRQVSSGVVSEKETTVAINSACGVFCFDPSECEHAQERKAEAADWERCCREAREIASIMGIDRYDPKLVRLYGNPFKATKQARA